MAYQNISTELTKEQITMEEQAALNNSGFHIKGFEVQDMIYMANFTHNGKDMQRAVWSQDNNLYITVGSHVEGNNTRYDFTKEECHAFQKFKRLDKEISKSEQKNTSILGKINDYKNETSNMSKKRDNTKEACL